MKIQKLLYLIAVFIFFSSCSVPEPERKADITAPKKIAGRKEIMNPRKFPSLWSNQPLAQKQELDKAILQKYETVKNNPDQFDYYYYLGMDLFKRCRLEEAAEAFDKAIQINPNIPEIYFMLACSYFFSKRYDLAQDSLTTGKRIGLKLPKDTSEYFRGTCPDEVDMIRAKIKLNIEKPYEKKGLYIKSLEEILNLPEEEIDIATFSLLLSQEAVQVLYNAKFDLAQYREKIDLMAADILKKIGGETRPEWIIGSINTYIFMDNKIQVPAPDTADLLQPKYNLINYLIDYRKGVCMSLSILYLSICERLQIPVYGVVIPNHFFLRYDDMINTINIETTALGKNYDNDFYRKEYPYLDNIDTLYFKNLNKKETIGAYLNNFGSFYASQKKYNEAVRLLKLSISINSKFYEPYANLGNIYAVNAEYEKALFIFNEGLKYNSKNSMLLKNIGKIYFQMGDLDKSLEELKMAQAINGKDPELHTLMGVIYRKKGYFDEAVLELRRALAYYPDSSDLNYQLALAYFQLKKYNDAWNQVKILRKQQYRMDPEFLKLLEKAQREPIN